MNSRLREAVIARDEKTLEQIIALLEQKDNWSLITIIDELLPLVLMETNLRYGNFHTVKMTLFLRRLALERYFSKTTERALARLLALEAARRDWVGISADRMGYADRNISNPAEMMIEELDKGNVHNAFYYAIGLMKKDPETLMSILLRLGANAIPRSLGHTLSCFFPVVSDIISVDHPLTDSAILSYLMFLARYGASKDVLQDKNGSAENSMDYYGTFLRLCASGTGIVELHHMITFYTATEWEQAAFNRDGSAPYDLIVDWVGDKELDRDREQRSVNSAYTGELPDTYEDFIHQFSFKKLDSSMPYIFRVLEENPRNAVDWLFRLYASYYDHGWDPHYYTSLNSALRLYMGDRVRDEVASRMALDQALHYFARSIT